MTEEKRGPGRPKKQADEPVVMQEPRIPCVVLKDYWPGDEDREAGWPTNERNRVKAGSVIGLTAEAAMDGIEIELVKRVK